MMMADSAILLGKRLAKGQEAQQLVMSIMKLIVLQLICLISARTLIAAAAGMMKVKDGLYSARVISWKML